ncbi:MAG: DEAD/DEAH box helicase, partial [archaeon]
MNKRSFNNKNSNRYYFQSHRKSAGSSGFGQRKQFGQSGRGIDPAKFVNKAIMGDDVENFIPEHRFQDFKIDQRLVSTIARKGYEIPTPIQDKIIKHIINGFDVVGIADTGTGKTAAFLFPIINKILQNPMEQALIVAPTRELAIQIDREFKTFTVGMRIFSV